jgi:hypothetical protein
MYIPNKHLPTEPCLSDIHRNNDIKVQLYINAIVSDFICTLCSMLVVFRNMVKYYLFLTGFRKSINYEEVNSNQLLPMIMSKIIGATNLCIL